MSWRKILLLVTAALLAGGFGLIASVAWYGPGPLLRGPLGQTTPLRRWLQQAQPGPTGLTVLLPGDRVTPFRLPGLTGPELTLPTPGRATLINYWASWCEPCRQEMPLLDAFARDQATNRVQVVGIALDDAAPALAYFRAGRYGFPSVVEAAGERDSSVRLGNTHGVLPYSVLIGADGRLLDTHIGAFEDAEALRHWVAAAH